MTEGLQRLEFTVKYKDVQPSVIYKTLTNADDLEKLTGVAAVSAPEPQGLFNVNDGEIFGQFLEVEENQRIKIQWRMRDWPAKEEGKEGESFDFADPANATSIVEMKFESYADGTGTMVSVTQARIPSLDKNNSPIEVASLVHGWKALLF